MSKRKYKYHTVNLPMDLAAKIKEAIESGKHGFTNIPDFVRGRQEILERVGLFGIAYTKFINVLAAGSEPLLYRSVRIISHSLSNIV